MAHDGADLVPVGCFAALEVDDGEEEAFGEGVVPFDHFVDLVRVSLC